MVLNTIFTMTLVGKIEEYVLQLEQAVTQLRQENQVLQQRIAQLEKPRNSLADELEE